MILGKYTVTGVTRSVGYDEESGICCCWQHVDKNIHSSVVEGEPSVIKFQPSFICDDDGLDWEQKNQETNHVSGNI